MSVWVNFFGTDFETWEGVCGKDGQGVPVGVGQPTLLISSLTVAQPIERSSSRTRSGLPLSLR